MYMYVHIISIAGANACIKMDVDRYDSQATPPDTSKVMLMPMVS